MNELNKALSEKMMQLRVFTRRQYVTNHGKGFGMLLYGIYKKAEGHPMTITEISQEFSVTVPAATQMVKMLKREGYVEIAKDPGDARITRVRVTPSGETVIRHVEDTMNAFLEGLTSHLGTEDSVRLDEILGKILDYLTNHDITHQGERSL
jgi:DNA-binding MarR family transcriptional regulator